MRLTQEPSLHTMVKFGKHWLTMQKQPNLKAAKKNMITVPLKKTTIPHEIIGKFGAARVLLKPASEGTGVIAGGAVRAVCEAAGIKDILTKSLRSDNALNVTRAAIGGLVSLKEEEKAVEEIEEEPVTDETE